MTFPDELRSAGKLTSCQRREFSFLHFVRKNNEAMLEAFEREMLGRRGPEGYHTGASRSPGWPHTSAAPSTLIL